MPVTAITTKYGVIRGGVEPIADNWESMMRFTKHRVFPKGYRLRGEGNRRLTEQEVILPGAIGVRRLKSSGIGFDVCTDVYSALRGLYHQLWTYSGERGDRYITEQMINEIAVINSTLPHWSSLGKKVQDKLADAIATLEDQLDGKHAITKLDAMEALAKGMAIGRVNPYAWMATNRKAKRQLELRLKQIDGVIPPTHAMIRKLIEIKLQGEQVFLGLHQSVSLIINNIKIAERQLPEDKGRIVTEAMRRIRKLYEDLNRVKFSPFLFNADLSQTELWRAYRLLERGHLPLAGRQQKKTLQGAALKGIQPYLEEIIFSIAQRLAGFSPVPRKDVILRRMKRLLALLALLPDDQLDIPVANEVTTNVLAAHKLFAEGITDKNKLMLKKATSLL